MEYQKNPCDICGSHNNLVTHPDGGIWCYTPNCKSNKDRKQKCYHNIEKDLEIDRESKDLIPGVFAPIPARRISQKTCEFFNYTQGVHNGAPVQIANFPGGQQIRTKDKRFYFRGNTDDLSLWGKDKWSNKGKSIIITEGQIDCMSIAETQDCKWPVVSLPNGAESAIKSIKKCLDWLLGFESIIICFDNDEAGKKALEGVVDLFPPGKLKIASLSAKDANEVLCKGGYDELARISFTASEYRPDGIVSLRDKGLSGLFRERKRGYRVCYPKWNDATRGLPPGRITTIYAKTGIGKTTIFKELILGLVTDYPELKIAGVFLEEDLDVTHEYLLCMQNNIATWKVKEDPTLLTIDQKQTAQTKLLNVDLYDHFGSIDPKRLLSLLEYWAVGKGVEVVILDHLSMIFSGLESSREGERKDIDGFMTLLRSLVERTGLHVITATQLKRRNRDRNDEGTEIITEEDARGSGSIEHISDFIIFANRNKRGDRPNQIDLELYKNRYTGIEGMIDTLEYDRETGRELPVKVVDEAFKTVLHQAQCVSGMY